MGRDMKISLIQCDIVLRKAKVPILGKSSVLSYLKKRGFGSMPPLGLLYLSSYLKKHGFRNIYVLDLILETDRKKALINHLKRLDRNDRNLIGFYMNTRTRFAVQEAIRIARKILPEAIICCGGPHPTLDRVGTLQNCEGLDFIVIGEGEETFLEVVRTLSDDFNAASLKNIPGISIKIGNEIVHNILRPRIRDLDSIPIPDRDMVPIRNYQPSFPVKDKELQSTLFPTTLITSRGCPYQCIFCSAANQWQRLNTYVSPERVVEEMRLVKEAYGFNSLYFCDDTFTLNKKRVEEICNRIIDEKLDMFWFCETRANTVDEELLTLMYEAGLRSVAMAVESASPRILKDVVKKDITLEQATDAIEMCRKIGIFAKIFFSYSYPNETLDDVKMTLDYAKKVQPDQSVFTRLLVYPGTPLFKYAIDNNLLPEKFDWFKYYPSYDSLSNQTLAPVFIDKLSTDDFVWIRMEVDKMAGASTSQKRSIFALTKRFVKACTKVKSREDFELLKSKIAGRLKQLFFRGGGRET